MLRPCCRNKIRNIGGFYFSKTEGPFSEALEEKLTNESLIIEDRDWDEPALRAQIGFVPAQDVSQGRFVTNRLPTRSGGELSEMIEKLLECFGFAPANPPLMLEKGFQEPLIQMGHGELGASQPPLQIPEQP